MIFPVTDSHCPISALHALSLELLTWLRGVLPGGTPSLTHTAHTVHVSWPASTRRPWLGGQGEWARAPLGVGLRCFLRVGFLGYPVTPVR